MRTDEIGGYRVLRLERDDEIVSTVQQGLDLIGSGWADRVHVIAIPVDKLAPDFFRLSTGFAGEFVQKFVNYEVTLAVVGDLAPQLAASTAFGDFVREADRGAQLWFVDDPAALDERLSARAPAWNGD